MTDITCTPAQVGIVLTEIADIYTLIAAAAITKGQPVYIDSNGKANVADANGSGTRQFRGIALETVSAGQPVSVLHRGPVYGYDLSGVAFDAAIYVSDTAGSLADAAGTTSLAVGKVFPIGDSKTVNKVLFVTGFAG